MVPGVGSFEAAEAAAVLIPLEDGGHCRVLSLQDLLRTKLAAGRPQDQVDIEFIRERIRVLNHGPGPLAGLEPRHTDGEEGGG